MEGSVKIFISYADKDRLLLERLEKHLALLQRQGLVTLWHNRNISAGKDKKSIPTQDIRYTYWQSTLTDAYPRPVEST